MNEYEDYGSEDPYSIFVFAMNASQTREKYTTRIDRFFRFVNIQGNTIQERCKAFYEIAKEITGATIRNYVKSIKLFCEMNDILIPWKKITRGLPRGRRYAEDRAPTIEEIRRVIEYPDRRIKAIVFTMASSGIRVGAWNYLRWGHIIPVERDRHVVAAKIIVYAGDEEEYFSFISPEAYHELRKWMVYRKESGEAIDNQSWVMRNIWDTKRGYMKGLVTAPKKLKHSGVKRLMEDALWTQGLEKN